MLYNRHKYKKEYKGCTKIKLRYNKALIIKDNYRNKSVNYRVSRKIFVPFVILSPYIMIYDCKLSRNVLKARFIKG